MARIRSVHQRFALDEDLAALADHVQLAHAYLPCHFDKAGRCEDKPKTLRALVFPHRPDIDMDDVIAQLTGIGKLIRYEVDGKRYLQWVDFAEIHHPHHSEQASKIPAPSDNGGSTVHTPGINGVPTVVAPLEPAQSLVSGLLSLVDGGESRESQGAEPLSLSTRASSEEEDQTAIVDAVLGQLAALYLEVKRVPFSGSVEKFRQDVTEAIGSRPLSQLDRCLRVVRYGLNIAGPARAFPLDREGFRNLFRNWSAFEESAVRADKVTPIDPATGEPEPSWEDACRAVHQTTCSSRERCHDRQRQDRQRQEREQREAERAAAIEAAGGEEAFQAQQAAMRKDIWERARNGGRAMSA